MEIDDKAYAAFLRRLEDNAVLSSSNSGTIFKDQDSSRPTPDETHLVTQETTSPPAKPAPRKSKRKRKPPKPDVEKSTTPVLPEQPPTPLFSKYVPSRFYSRSQPSIPRNNYRPLRQFIYDTHSPSDLSKLVADRTYSPKELSSLLKMNEESIAYVRPLLDVPENSPITGADYRMFNEKTKYLVSLHHLLSTSPQSDLSRTLPLVASYLADSDEHIRPFLQNFSSTSQPIYMVPLVAYKMVRSTFVQIDKIYDPQSIQTNEAVKKQKVVTALNMLDSRLTPDALSGIGILTSSEVDQILDSAKTKSHPLYSDSRECTEDEVIRYDLKKFIDFAQTNFLQSK